MVKSISDNAQRMNCLELLNARITRRTTSGLFAVGGGHLLLNPVRTIERFAPKEKEPVTSTEVIMLHGTSFQEVVNIVIPRIENGQQPISLETLVKSYDDKETIPNGLKTFLITCDDGYVSSYEAFIKAIPYIQKNTNWYVPVAFFAMTGGLADFAEHMKDVPNNAHTYGDLLRKDLYVTKKQLIDLIELGVWVDTHTMNHALLTQISKSARDDDIVKSRKHIRELWEIAGREKPFDVIAYPNGWFDDDLLIFVKEQGFAAGFSTDYTTSNPELQRFAISRRRM